VAGSDSRKVLTRRRRSEIPRIVRAQCGELGQAGIGAFDRVVEHAGDPGISGAQCLQRALEASASVLSTGAAPSTIGCLPLPRLLMPCRVVSILFICICLLPAP